MSGSLFFPFREFDNKELGNKDTPIKMYWSKTVYHLPFIDTPIKMYWSKTVYHLPFIDKYISGLYFEKGL
jgi:hypothetical protein